MTVLPILIFPERVLKQKAKRVKHIDGSIKKLVRDCWIRMRASGDLEDSHPQVGVP